MLAHLERANLVVPLNSETAAGLRRTWEGRRRVPVLHEVADLGAEVPATAAAWIRQTVHGLGDRVPVSEEAWRQTISPRDILAAQAERDAWKKELASENLGRDVADVDPALGQLREMTVCTEYESRMGGIPTVNKLLTEALANAGAQAYARVALVRSDVPQILSSHRPSGIRIRGVWSVPTGTDYPVLADARALSILPDNLPARVNVLIGHSRFGGGAAKVLQESYYPDATRIHVLHTAPEILDAIRGDPAQGSTHAQTERDLIVGAQVVSGVGPLLTREVGRLAPQGHGNQPPIVHQIIPDMPGRRINPSPLPPGGRNFVVGVQGRAGDPIKRLELAAHVVRELNRQGMPTRLVVRGAPSLTEARAQAAALTEIAESSVTVRTYSTNREQLNHDLFEADLMLMPSIHEGFGMVAAEAAQSGVPVLVGEGTGAGLFFGDPALVDPTLGESAIVRDGNTVESLADALGSAGVRAERPYAERMELASQVRDAIDDSRLPFWVSRAAAILDDIEYHRERAVALRDYLDRTYPTGRLARDLLNALRRVRGD
jgi:glycosyltransferase involved in cell wall biosynthesis